MLPIRPVSSKEHTLLRFGWLLLGGLLLWTVLQILTQDRSAWPDLLPGESTVLMQAASLAQDLDLSYTRADFDRFLITWNGQPPDLELASLDGERVGFDRPFPYALWLAPFMRLWPKTGFAVANGVLLVALALLMAFALRRRLGPSGPLWTAVLLFASVAHVHVFLATGSFFGFALGVLAFLCLEPDFVDRRSLSMTAVAPSGWRYWLCGFSLSILVATDPLWCCLLIGALFVPVERRRSMARSSIVLGFGIGLSMMLAVAWWTSGALLWLYDGGFRFIPETGFPLVDFTAVEWKASVKRFSAMYWEGAPRLSWGLDPWLALWNGLYLAIGRHFGILPYFAPVLLLILSSELDRPRRALLGGAFLWTVLVLIFQPFAFNGTDATIGLGFFLPLYGALFMMPARIVRSTPQLITGAVVVTLLAAPFLWRVWLAPAGYPIAHDGTYTHVTGVAKRILPYESSQRWIASGQRAETEGLWVRFLNDGAWAETQRNRLVVDGDAEVQLMITSSLALDRVILEFGDAAPSQIEVGGGTPEERVLLPDGGIAFHVATRRWPSRRHALWWTPQAQYVYLLSFRLPGAGEVPLPLRLSGRTAS